MELMLLIVVFIVIVVILIVGTCCCFYCYERGLRQAKKFNQENFRPQDTIHCRCHNIVTDTEHSYEIPCPPTCKPSQERTRNQCHNNETDKKQSYEIPCPQTTTTETSQETSCHNNKTDEEHSYEKPCPPSNEASEKNRAESAAYGEIKKKKFEGVENQKIGEERYLTMVRQQCPLPSMKTENYM